MNCPRCRGVAPVGAAFCPNCGNDLRVFQQPQPTQQLSVKEQLKQAKAAAPAGYYQSQPGVAPAPRKKSPLGWVLGIGVALALIVVGFFAFNSLKRTDTASGSPVLAKQGQEPDLMLQQRGKTEGAILQQQGKTEGAVLQDTAQRAKNMPEDVRRWLEHLERIEKLRGKLAQKGLAQMMMLAQTASLGMDLDGLKALANADPDSPEPKMSSDKIAEASQQTKADWAELKRDFASYSPPAECQKIADPYSHALDETGAMISDVLDALVLAKDDTQAALQSLYGMQNQSKSIDEYGNTTDGRLQDICDKYDTRKWFKISSDFGNTSMFGSLGMR